MFSWLSRLMGGTIGAPRAEDPLSQIRWVAAADSPFGVDVLDCRAFSQAMLSTAEDREVAETFARLRSSNGEQYRGRAPEDSTTCACDLQYPHRGEVLDGPLFKAEEMEDKWDIYLYDGELYLTRSWTGELAYRAAIAFREDRARVTAVTARPALFENDRWYPVAIVDYLIRSHLYRLPIPHPLPKSAGRDPRVLALFSFSQYGRHGLYGTFADTTRLSPPPVAG